MTSQGLAVVTGASGGLGAPIARRLAEAGYALALVDMNPAVEELAGTMRQEGFDATAFVANLSDDAGIAAVVAGVRASPEPLTLLVNNAGITRDARLQKMEVSDFDQVIEVNILAAMRLTEGLTDVFADGASVVSMSSRAALGNFGQANYVTAKSALIGFTRALAQRWAPRVRANVVSPGLVDTPMTQGRGKMPLMVTADVAARRIAQALEGGPEVVYVAWPWRYIMLILQHIPSILFRRFSK